MGNAIFDIRLSSTATPLKVALDTRKLISKIATTRHHFDAGAWKVIGHQKPSLPQRKWPNEQFRRRGWIGAECYTGAIVESFLNAFYGLAPWDEYKDPNYFDKFLLSPAAKPPNLIYAKRPPAS